MRRAFVGNFVGVKSVMLLVLALMVMIGAGPALAQENYEWRTFTIDYYKFGASTNLDASDNVVSVSAILCASDAYESSLKDGDVWKGNADGKLAVSDSNNVGLLTAKTADAMSRPIIANIERGEQLFMVGIIDGVDSADVNSLRAAPADPASNPVMAGIIDMVTAELDKELFGANADPAIYANLHPTFATSTFDIKKNVGKDVMSPTSVVVYFDIAGLTVSATDSKYAKQSFSATMAINGGPDAKKVASSNFIGVETGLNSAPEFLLWANGAADEDASDWWDRLDPNNNKGREPGVSIGIQIDSAFDPNYAAWTASSGIFDPRVILGQDSIGNDIPFQFTKANVLGIKLELRERPDLDGEPDQYFGAGGSDTLTFASNGSGTDQSVGAKLSFVAQKTDDFQNVFSSVNVLSIGDDASSDQKIVTVEAAIADTVITAGSYRVFTLDATLLDEVTNKSSASCNHAIDTAGPFYTKVTAEAERADLDNDVVGGDIGYNSTDRDEGIFTFEIDGNGESAQTANIEQWLDFAFKDVGRSVADFDTATHHYSDANADSLDGIDDVFVSLDDVASYPAYDADPVEGTLITNIPDNTQILGAKLVVKVQNNVSTTLNSGGVIARTFDDARNPAVVYPNGLSSIIEFVGDEVEFDTTRNTYSITSFDKDTGEPLTYNLIKPATVEVDNAEPEIIAAQLSASGLPSAYSNGGIDLEEAFDLLSGSKESVGGLVTRAAAGSPLRLVVQFKPTADDALAGDDTDGAPYIAKNTSENISGFQKRFSLDITNSNLGYANVGPGKNVLASDTDKARWSIEDATLLVEYVGGKWTGIHANTIGWVTFVESAGIPESPAEPGLDDESLTIGFADSALNYDGANTASSGITIDTRAPQIDLLPDDTVVDADDYLPGGGLKTGYEANTGVYIVDYKVDSADYGLDLTDANFGPFKNDATIADVTIADVQAGDSIIITARFFEEDTDDDGILFGIGGDDQPFTQVGDAYSGFPFILGSPVGGTLEVGSVDDWNIDDAGTLYGSAFRTIAANFVDFVDDADDKDVLPDYWEVLPPAGTGSDTNPTTVAPGQIVEARWFYYIDGNKNLNLKSQSDIRGVTLTARDLSGNVSRYNIGVATAAFVKPLVTILDYQIDNPLRGIQGAVIQRDASYMGGADNAAAIQLSQATVSVKTDKDDSLQSATLKIVAKIGDGVSKGGPLRDTDYLYADFSPFGGSVEAPDAVTYADGTAVTKGSDVGPTDILYATWTGGPFVANTSLDSAGAADKEVIVRAVAKTLGAGEAKTTKIQLDSKVPYLNEDPSFLLISDIREKRGDDDAPTAPRGDVNGDGIIRPNQTVSFYTRYHMDAFDKKSSRSLAKFAPDLGQFGSPEYRIWTWDVFPAPDPNTGIQDRSVRTIRGATFEFVIPDTINSGFYKAIAYATDAAGNFLPAGKSTTLITVNASRPQIQSIVLDASSAIMTNYATDTIKGTSNAFRTIGTRVITNPTKPEFGPEDIRRDGKHSIGNTIVKKGDMLKVITFIKINDDIFATNDIDVKADFSAFSGPAYAEVVPAPITDAAAPDFILQGTSISGSIYYATWVHKIQPSDQNINDASVKIIARNPAGLTEAGIMAYSVPIVVDNEAPEVSQMITYYKNGLVTTAEEINPNNKIALTDKTGAVLGTADLQPGRATAALVVSASFNDAGDQRGYAGSLLSAFWFDSGLDVNDPVAQKKSFKLDGKGVLGTNNPDAAFFALSDQSGVWRDGDSSTDGALITSASSFSGVDSAKAGQLKQGTATVLNAWFGAHPDGKLTYGNINDVGSGDSKAVMFSEGAGKTDVKLETTVYDSVYNAGKPSMSGIQVDGIAPQISIGRNTDHNGDSIGNATLTVSPGQEAGIDYIPAQYTPGGVLERPTIVGPGTKVRLETHIFDKPNTSDQITFSVNGAPFNAKASSFEVVSPTPRVDKPNKSDKIWWVDVDPTQFSGNVVDVVVDIPIGWELKTNNIDGNTIDYNTNSVADAVSWSSYKAALDALQSGASASAMVPIDATDTVQNWRFNRFAKLGVAIDTEGPGVIEEFTTFLPTKEDVDKLGISAVFRPDQIGNINALAGTYLVWAATMVIDGTEDVDFPLDRFMNDWAAKFEFDTDRLEHDKAYNGKKYLISSATRSIIFVTSTIKIKDDADPRNATHVGYHLEDRWGNSTENESGDWIAISAQGPIATEISMTVDGKTETVVGVGKLGIGNRVPDSASAQFEIMPGAQVIIDATITTFDGGTPDTVTLDISDFYPRGLRNVFNQIIPTVNELTSSGVIHAQWKYTAYDVANIMTTGANKDTAVIFDQSNLDSLTVEGADPNGQFPPSGPIAGATPVSEITVDGIDWSQVSLIGGPRTNQSVGSQQAAVDALMGLPFIQVQKDATAKQVAWVTVFVDDEQSMFGGENAYSSVFAVDTEPPRASIVLRPFQNEDLKILDRVEAGPRIGLPTAPNASRTDLLDPAPRVRGGDVVQVIISATNELISGDGNDAFRPLPGDLPEDLNSGFFRITAGDSTSIQDLTADLSGFSSAPGFENASVFDPNLPVPDGFDPNIVTIDSQGEGMPDLITAIYSLEVSDDLGTTVVDSNNPVDVAIGLVDDAGNHPVDTAYDKIVLLDNNNYSGSLSDKSWVSQFANKWAERADQYPHVAQAMLAVDNRGPAINGSIAAQIISGSALVDDPLTGGMIELKPGDMLRDQAVLSAGTVLRVTLTVTELVDHPLDLVIEPQNNFGEMKMYAEGLKLADSRLFAADARLSGMDSVKVPFQVTMPSKEEGKSTFAFHFISQATDTVGNMSEKMSTESFAFDANPDLTYEDIDGQLVDAGSTITVNASDESQLLLSANALDVGGLTTVEWMVPELENIAFTAVDADGNPVEGMSIDAGGEQLASLDLFALIPVVTGGVTPFDVQAKATDIEGNPSAESIVTVNINQPPIIVAELPFDATTDAFRTSQGVVEEMIGLGYNTAFGDVREVTIAEGSHITIKIAANDSNVDDAVVLSATGTAVTSENILEGLPVSASGAGAGELDFSFKPGYMAVTGEADSATFELDVTAHDGTSIAPDTMKLVFNVLAKSATPVVTIDAITVGGQAKPTTSDLIELLEGETVQINFSGFDPGEEEIVSLLKSVPESVPANLEVSPMSEDGIVYATYTFTAGLQDADIPEVGYDSPIDPLFASFSIANASFSGEALVPIDIINVSQAPIITANAFVGIQEAVAVVDGDRLVVETGSQIIVEYRADDPDGDAVLTNLVPEVISTLADIQIQYTPTEIGAAYFESMLTLVLPATVAPEDATITVVYTASDNNLQERTHTFTIFAGEEAPPIEEVDIDTLLIAQGAGSTENLVTYKNIDADVSEIDGKPVTLTSTYRSLSVARGDFQAKIGGGLNRAAYVSVGDVNGDGEGDVILSMGPVTEPDGEFPSIVVAKDAKTKTLIGNSFDAFNREAADPALAYPGGDIQVAVGNFTGSSMDQIATAQGVGGSNVIRIYEYTGQEPPLAFQVVAQFNGLVGPAWDNNADGGQMLAAGDLTGDGIDELIVAQYNSATSRTQFSVIGVNSNGTFGYRTNGVAFPRKFQGNGGVDPVVADLNGDGVNELLFASAGNTQDFVENEDGRNTAILNVVSIWIPVVTDGKVTGFTKPAGNVRNIFPAATNPSGAQSMAKVEIDGTAGDELVIGTGAVLNVDGTSVTAIKAAPLAKYTFVNIDFDGTAVTGVSDVGGGFAQAAIGHKSFPDDIMPTSGATNVAAGQID
ncbi:MAG: VCBS repeat-containing protein [Candidatus Omnitrophica bacterium]|nr:VCBS repeat-containing protein [Candidatus Omnitrophota bacterium]